MTSSAKKAPKGAKHWDELEAALNKEEKDENDLAAHEIESELADADKRRGMDGLTAEQRRKVRDTLPDSIKNKKNYEFDETACGICLKAGMNKKKQAQTTLCEKCGRLYYCGSKCQNDPKHREFCDAKAQKREQDMIDKTWAAFLTEYPDLFQYMCDMARFGMATVKMDDSVNKELYRDVRDQIMIVEAKTTDEFKSKGLSGNPPIGLDWWPLDRVSTDMTRCIAIRTKFLSRNRDTTFCAILRRNGVNALKFFDVPATHQSDLCTFANVKGARSIICDATYNYQFKTPKEKLFLQQVFRFAQQTREQTKTDYTGKRN